MSVFEANYFSKLRRACFSPFLFMAYSDNPIIDRYSNNEERSERKVREYLNQDTGFICRAEVPDKGCDLDVELILDGGKSSSWKFPIQLKSIEKLDLVNNKQFISLPFETSRLGYLMRRIPSMGVIIFYSVKENKCFYEFADKIYSALTEDRGSEEWKGNDNVNIRISYSNLLDEGASRLIHDIMRHRYEQATIMQSSFGEKYGLPTVGLVDNFQFDFRNVDDLKRFLQEYGLLLLNNYDLGIIQDFITQIPNQEIYRDKELLLIAAVSYAEASQHTESQLFCKKLLKFQLNETETLMLRFVELKNNHALGYLSDSEMIGALEELKEVGTDEQNKITIAISQIYYKLGQIKAFINVPEPVISGIHQIFEAIEKSSDKERTKLLLTLWNCENLSYLISSIASARFGEVRIREALGEKVTIEERQEGAVEIIRMETMLHEKVLAINKSASVSDDKLMKAYSMALDVKHYIHHQVNYLAFEVPVSKQPDFEKRLSNKIAYAATAYNYFIELRMDKEAYENLCNMLEMIELAQGYNVNVSYDKMPLYDVKTQMEAVLETPVRIIMFPGLLEEKRMQQETKEGSLMIVLKSLSDEQLQSLAKTTLLGLQLPETCLPNLVVEMKAYRLFHQRCSDNNIIVLQKKNEYEIQHPYVLPIRFVLRSKATGIETSPSSDMDALLTMWGY